MPFKPYQQRTTRYWNHQYFVKDWQRTTIYCVRRRFHKALPSTHSVLQYSALTSELRSTHEPWQALSQSTAPTIAFAWLVNTTSSRDYHREINHPPVWSSRHHRYTIAPDTRQMGRFPEWQESFLLIQAAQQSQQARWGTYNMKAQRIQVYTL